MNTKRRLLRGCVVALAGCVIAVAAIGAFLCDGALRRPAVRESASLNPDEQSAAVTADDGVKLRGVYLRPLSKARGCILILHGIGDTHVGMEALGRKLEADGYAVLVPDSRGHGWSGGALVTYGVKESGDVQKWVNWLEWNGCGVQVYGLGESLGGAVLLQSLRVEKRFRAVVAEGAYSSFLEIAIERIHQQSGILAPFERPFIYAGLGYAYLRYGLKLWEVSAIDAVRTSSTPVLLIHGLLDRNTSIVNSRRIAAANPRIVQLWEVPLAAHAAAFGTAPEAFENRVLAWFAR